MNLTLYKTTSQNNVIGKVLSDPLEISINLKRTEDQERPRILLKNENGKYQGYNYAYIEYFNRYYFIESKSNNNERIIELQLNTDVLETYKNDILNTTGNVITKVGTTYSNNIVDSDVRKDHTIYQSDVTPQREQTNVLITIGG